MKKFLIFNIFLKIEKYFSILKDFAFTFILIGGLLLLLGQEMSYAQSANLTVAEALAQRNQKTSIKTEKPQVAQNSGGDIRKASANNNFPADPSIPSSDGEVRETIANNFYQDPTLVEKTSENDYLSLWIKLILIMGIFCGAGYLILRYLKQRSSQQNGSDSKIFFPISEYAFGMNKKIQIIKILNDYYVLAVGQDEINVITKIEDKESIDLLALEGNKKPVSNFFEDSFKNYINAGSWSPTAMTKALKNKVRRL